MKKTLLAAIALCVATGATFAAAPKDAAGKDADKVAAPKGMEHKDKKFFEEAATGGMFEVEVGKLAEQKGQSADVKAYGSMLAKDHSAANDELKALAQKKGVALPTAMPKDMQKDLDKLSKEKDFDKEFVKKVGLKDHKKDIKLFEHTAKDSKDADVQAFASKTLPTLQAHHAKAEELEKAMKGQKHAAK